MPTLRPLASTLLLILLGAAPLFAQDASARDDARIADGPLLAETVAEHESATDATRAELEELLALDEVRELAETRGIAVERVREASTTLSDRELARLAPLIEEATAALQRSRTITISVSTVIIILLLLILLT